MLAADPVIDSCDVAKSAWASMYASPTRCVTLDAASREPSTMLQSPPRTSGKRPPVLAAVTRSASSLLYCKTSGSFRISPWRTPEVPIWRRRDIPVILGCEQIDDAELSQDRGRAIEVSGLRLIVVGTYADARRGANDGNSTF